VFERESGIVAFSGRSLSLQVVKESSDEETIFLIFR